VQSLTFALRTIHQNGAPSQPPSRLGGVSAVSSRHMACSANVKALLTPCPPLQPRSEATSTICNEKKLMAGDRFSLMVCFDNESYYTGQDNAQCGLPLTMDKGMKINVGLSCADTSCYSRYDNFFNEGSMKFYSTAMGPSRSIQARFDKKECSAVPAFNPGFGGERSAGAADLGSGYCGEITLEDEVVMPPKSDSNSQCAPLAREANWNRGSSRVCVGAVYMDTAYDDTATGPGQAHLLRQGRDFSTVVATVGTDQDELGGFKIVDQERCRVVRDAGELTTGAREATTVTMDGDAIPPIPEPGVEKDPHLHFAHGGRADFRGKDGQLYCFLSAPSLAVNLKTEEATFPLYQPVPAEEIVVDGTFITEVHVVALVGGDKRKWANVSYYASELDENNVGTRVIRGFCGGHSFKLGRGGQKTCEDLVVKVC